MPASNALPTVRLALLCVALLAALALGLSAGPAHAATTDAPQLAVSGETLTWSAVSGVSSYVFVRKVPGQSDQYSTVTGTSIRPAAVPGQTVRFSVRTNVAGSRWAPEVSITYRASLPSDPVLPDRPDAPAPPVLSASGQTLRWTAVAGAPSYLLLRRVSGQADQTTTVGGLTATPAAVPGQTARYAVRANVTGSGWSNEVAIAYPANPTTPPPTTPPPAGGFTMGVVGGTAHEYELQFVTALGARTSRLIYNIGTSASSMAATMEAYARAGVRPLLAANFHGRLPTSAEAQNLATWAAAYGPGGSFWRGKSYAATAAVSHIEFGNETSYAHQFADYSLPTYQARARTYAERTREAALAIRAANPNVGLLAIGDNAVNQQAWVINMFRAVPNLGDLVVGWTIHPYGTNWRARMDSSISSLKTVGSRDLPLWVTEWGLATDNGRCLSDNYGFNRCMSYAEAASTLRSTLTSMKATYGSRFGAFYLYQAHDQRPTGQQTGREYYFGALQQLGQAKGAYTTEVKAQLAANSR